MGCELTLQLLAPDNDHVVSAEEMKALSHAAHKLIRNRLRPKVVRIQGPSVAERAQGYQNAVSKSNCDSKPEVNLVLLETEITLFQDSDQQLFCPFFFCKKYLEQAENDLKVAQGHLRQAKKHLKYQRVEKHERCVTRIVKCHKRLQ